MFFSNPKTYIVVVAANVELVADATVIGGLLSDFLDIAENARDLKIVD